MDGQIYIPNNKKLQEQILQRNHNPINICYPNPIDIGYPGQQRMLELVKRNYWWPEIKEDVKYIQGYIKCQQNKVQHQKKPEELYSLKILQGSQQEISIDIIGPLLESNRNNAIVVIVDRFTKII